MAGLLNRIQKKSKGTSMASELLVEGGGTRAIRVPENTQIITTNSELGSVDDLLADLQKESKGGTTSIPVPTQVAQTPQLNSGNTNTMTHTRIKVVGSASRQSQSVDQKKKKSILDEALPWWLTEGPKSSPQVDILIPAARRILNDMLSDNIPAKELPAAIKKAVMGAVTKLAQETRFSQQDVEEAIEELISLMSGKGPLQSLYDDPAVTDIYLDGHASIKCVRRGQAIETPFRFRTPDEYESYITGMMQSVDRVLNLSSPIVDCVLNDHCRSRINAVHSSLLDGAESSLVIRVPRLQKISFYDILQTKTLPATVAAWLAELVSCGEANILVCGATGSGKTVMTTALLSAVGSDERICTIEDVPEIFVPTAHLEKLVARPENSQGEGSVGMERLLRAALRRAPHRIVVGEIRDREGPLFLKALETGHAGSVATIHAENPRDCLWRLLDVVAALETAPQESIQRRIGRAINIIISMKKVGGKSCLIDISEVRPPVGGEFVVKQLVQFESDSSGKRQWRIMANHSEWIDHLRTRGMDLQAGPGLLPFEKDRKSQPLDS